MGVIDMKKAIVALMAILAAVLFVACSAPAHASVSTTKLGLFKPSNNDTYTIADGHSPSYAIQYYGWYEGFQTADAKAAWSHGTTTFAELQTCGNPCDDATSVPITSVTAGTYDTYLKDFATAVKAFGHPVYVTFDHEMNGNWYPWGYQAVTPAQWIAAWDHVRAVMKPIAPNLTFVWAPNTNSNSAYPMQDYYPGASECGVVGVDGYYRSSTATWSNSGLAAAYTEEHALAPHKPFIVAETGVVNVDGADAQIANLVSNAKADHALAVFYFDSGEWALNEARAHYLWSLL